MGRSVGKVGAHEHHKVDVVHHGEQIILPDGMDIDQCINTLKLRKKHMQQQVEVRRSFNVFPWDGAHALMNVLTERFGFAMARKIPGGLFSPDQPPQTIDIEVDHRKKIQVPWGRFGLPSLPSSDFIETGIVHDKGMLKFTISALVERRFEQFVVEIFNDIEAYLATNSIYRGKAVRIRFRDNRGEPLGMPVPEFMDTSVEESQLIYSKHVEDAINTNLFTPIRRVADCDANGISFKRGVLLGGPYGTGKTMAAQVASNIAVEHGVTFIYAERADELDQAFRFAEQYANPASVVFCEDIDRAMSGERTVKTDDLLNVIDGIDSKNTRIMTVLTTNALEQIEPAMLRPGRLDAVINVVEPDAEAVERLVRAYGKDYIDPDEDLTAVGEELDGCIPAAVAEVVKRAKLSELRRTEEGEQIKKISADALLEAARTLTSQLELLVPPEKYTVPHVDQSFEAVIRRSVQPAITEITGRLDDLAVDIDDLRQ